MLCSEGVFGPTDVGGVVGKQGVLVADNGIVLGGYFGEHGDGMITVGPEGYRVGGYGGVDPLLDLVL